MEGLGPKLGGGEAHERGGEPGPKEPGSRGEALDSGTNQILGSERKDDYIEGEGIPVEDDVCPECGGGNIVYDRGTGEVICGACGLVLRESTISLGPEWRAFTPGEEETRSRVGAPSASPSTIMASPPS